VTYIIYLNAAIYKSCITRAAGIFPDPRRVQEMGGVMLNLHLAPSITDFFINTASTYVL